ncbi:hypothetical protein DAPPUDRAFT_56718 [Daphnia pulex]|uniref:Septin-type G domain-containing protein n=1 Tax=Daphnia pulex TaxID=6669 RepID=E9H0H4_DAPPU|nr:hypothetical protein DAPPUDRAFT_56718 [Daphnia pulex]|eukprot:EFX74806.1 hypothetical protein DAPPUDRAFT_56718 [Daphnia pulex]
MTRTCKTILLMGATGSGKTTWINAMINYVLRVEWDDPFRFILVDEKLRGASQANSQTQGVTAYELRYRDGFRIPFSLTIIGTPGFGDTRGIDRDKEITLVIKNLFIDKNGIEDLDALGIVVESALVRLTGTQYYIFNSVFEIFSRDIEENIHFLLTFSDGSSPLVLDAIKQAGLPCRKDSEGSPRYQEFNSAIYETQQPRQQPDDDFFHSHWKKTMGNFKSFFEELSDMPTKSLQMTKEVLRIKKFLEMHRESIQKAIDEQLMKMEELRKTEEIIAQNRDKVNDNKDFDIKVLVMKKLKVVVQDGKKALNCTQCQVTCHYPCNPSIWEESCQAFSTHTFPSNCLPGNAPCNVCPGKCLKDEHQHEDFKWDSIQQEETQTLYEVSEKYKAAEKRKSNAEEILHGLKEEIERLKSDIFKTMEEITDCSNVLKEIALQGNPLTVMDHIQIIIDDENRDEKPGCEERIKSLQDLKIAFKEKK